MRRSFLVSALCFLVLVCVEATGQVEAVDPSAIAAPSDEVVQQWLASDDPRVQAWGAHAVLEGHRTELLPAVIALITQSEVTRAHTPLPQTNYDQEHAEADAFDALIQLGGNLPVALLAKLDAWPQRLVLLARLPWSEAEPVWSKLYKPEAPWADESRIAAEMLARHRSAGFAARLLNTISVKVLVEVHNPGTTPVLSGIGSGWSGPGGWLRRGKPWPVMGAYSFSQPYSLVDEPIPGMTLWLAGRDPIYLERTLTDAGFIVLHSSVGSLRIDDRVRSHLVARLLGDPAETPFAEYAVTLDIPFTTGDGYRQTVVKEMQAQQANFRSVALRFASLGLLTEEQRKALDLRMEFCLNDTRSKPARDLPVIAFREPVKWVSSLW